MKQGFIKATYLDHLGTDLAVVNAARASFDKESTWDYGPPTEHLGYDNEVTYRQERVLKETDARLIRFLASGYRTGEWSDFVATLTEVGHKNDPQAVEAMLRTFKGKAQHWAPFAHPHISIRAEMPIFLALFYVLNSVSRTPEQALGYFFQQNPALAESLHNATIFGAQLSSTFLPIVGGFGATQWVTATLVVLMTVVLFITQLQLMRKNMPPESLTGPMAQQQKMMLYLFPVMYLFSGVYIQIGVLT